MPVQEVAEEALCCSRVPAARDQNVYDVTVLVHRPPEIPAFAADLDEHLIHRPDIAKLTLLTAQVSSKRGTEIATPQPDRLVGHGDATLGEQVLDIVEAQSGPVVQLHSVADDLRWEAVASIKGFSRSSVPHRRELESTLLVAVCGTFRGTMQDRSSISNLVSVVYIDFVVLRGNRRRE